MNKTSPHYVGIYNSEELVNVRETSLCEVSAKRVTDAERGEGELICIYYRGAFI